MISVTTAAFDNARSGANLQESEMTAQAVAERGIRKLFTVTLPGDARGCEAQPLIAAQVAMPDGGVRNLLLLATMANLVLAADADTGEVLWTRVLARPVDGSRKIDMYDINDHWGILSTPVLDLETLTLFACAWQSPDGTVGAAQHFLYAINLLDGTDKLPAVNLEGAFYDPGPGHSTLLFRSSARKQRAALLMTNVAGRKTVFIGFGSLTESAADSRGWVVAVDCASMQVATAWASTAVGNGGGVWQAGSGLAAGDDGSIYLVTGNGDFAPPIDLGESLVQLDYVPAAVARNANLAASDWFSPFMDSARTAAAPVAADDDEATPSNHRPLHAAARAAAKAGCVGMVDRAMSMSVWSDMDLGSAGPTIVASCGLMLACGKDGVLFAAKLGAMGKTSAGDLASVDGTRANYAKLAFKPIFFTYYPPTLSPHPDDISTLNLLWDNRSHHLHGSPVHFLSPDHGDMLFGWGENGNLRAWQLSAASITYLACGAEVASPNSPVPPGGMPGGMLAVSANGAEPGTGIVWAVVPYGDGNMEITNGRLLAYDAQTFGTFKEGAKQLRVLWDSQDWNIAFLYAKFGKPVPANGKLYVATYGGTVDVYGLA